MYTCAYPNLFSPLKIGDVTFRNRIFASPMGCFHTDGAHHPVEETNALYERKAKGLCATVCVGDASVDGKHASHVQFNGQLDDPDIYPALARTAHVINKHGAVASLELVHAGTAASYSYEQGYEIYGPIEEEINGRHITAIDRERMDIIIDQFVKGALLAKQVGFKMILLHAGHGFLFQQFFSPLLNKRTDEYGGSLENNVRFPLEIVRAIRKAVGPKFPIEMRISGAELSEGGYDIEYGCKIAEAFDGLVDIIHVSCGSHEDMSVFTTTHPSMFLEDGVNVYLAEQVKKHVKKSYVATVGALADPKQLEEIIASGKADIVEIARGLIADPDLPRKAREGRDDEIVRCIRCFSCFSTLLQRGHMTCALNPEIADMLDNKYGRRAAAPKKVVILGGGIAGMEAALVSNSRGHDVTLIEMKDKLGGVMRCEENVPFKKHIHEYLEVQANKVLKSNIKVLLNTKATKELVSSLEPDVLICAIGSKLAMPPIEGIEKTMSAIDVYTNPELAKGKVVILGGGLVGSELAIYLKTLGKEAIVVEMNSELSVGDNMLHGLALNIELAKKNIEVHTSTKAMKINETSVEVLKDGKMAVIEADTAINALGMTPLNVEEFRFLAKEFHQIGNCLKAETIKEATSLAYQIANDIGEE